MSLSRDEIDEITAPFLAADLAMEVRSVYDERLTAGEAPGPATASVFETFRNVLADADDGPVVFLAIAAIQLREHHLLDPIRDAALALIDSGDAQRAWRPMEASVNRDRKQALEQLASVLRGEV
ncbi:MAG TPA: hypothetical protein VF595_16205 [Tepidisphaeraceae bacterium]|jgi:hypothetical protein